MDESVFCMVQMTGYDVNYSSVWYVFKGQKRVNTIVKPRMKHHYIILGVGPSAEFPNLSEAFDAAVLAYKQDTSVVHQ